MDVFLKKRWYLRALLAILGFLYVDPTIGCSDGDTTTILTSASPTATIQSPNYPSDYDHSEDHCWTIITADPASPRIKFTINAFHLESAPSCSFDYVQLYDGSSSSDDSFGKYCGTNQPSCDYVTSGSSMYIRFRSDVSHAYSGFSFTLTATSDSSNDCSPLLSTGAIVGIVFAGIIVIVIIILIVACAVQNCKKGSSVQPDANAAIHYNARSRRVNLRSTANQQQGHYGQTNRGGPHGGGYGSQPPPYPPPSTINGGYSNTGGGNVPLFPPPPPQYGAPSPQYGAPPPSYSSLGNLPPPPVTPYPPPPPANY